MKRSKKITKKADPVEESSESDGSGSEDAPTMSTKKGKNRGKKTKSIKSGDSVHTDTEQKPKQSLNKNGKGKGKKSTKTNESSQISGLSDSDEAPSKTKTKGKGKAKSTKLSQSIEGSSYNSDSDDIVEKPTKPVKKGKRNLKNPEPVGEESDNSDSEVKETQVKKKRRHKKATRVDSREDVSDNSEENTTQSSKTGKGKGKKSSTKKEPIAEPTDDSDPDQNSQSKKKEKSDDMDVASDGELSNDTMSDPELSFDPIRHKESLLDLKGIDPEFYQFLMENDADLLKFNDHVNTLDDGESDNEQDLVHTPGELHGGSDESDFEEEDAVPIKGKVTLKMVKEWEAELQKDGKMKQSTLIHAVNLFHAAVLRATSEDGTTVGEYNVAGSSVFNAILNMCVLHLPVAFNNYLGLDEHGKNPQKCKHFVKIKGILIQYLSDIVNLLSVVTSENILTIMLKHLHQMAHFVACFTRIAKSAIKRLITLWSTGEETVRVLAFLCILRFTHNQHQVLLEPVLKAMFMTYVKNCKFVSPTTWPGINFMRRSLLEVFMLDLDLSYRLVFLYIRQLGIHLRNAIIVPKKENKLAVCNWQYLNSLHLWAVLLQQTVHHSELKSLIFPLSLIVTYSIKLVPAPKYYPMRFYLTEILMDLSRESGEFIPIFGFLVDVLYKFDFNRKVKVSMKPLDFSCIIRLSKSQMSETGYKDTVVDRWYALALEYSTTYSYKYAYPEIIVVLTATLTCLLKKFTVPNYKKKFTQLLEKLEENSVFMSNARLSYKGSMCDGHAIMAWETKIKEEKTPLINFFENWSKINKIEKRQIFAKNRELAGTLPLVKRLHISEEANEQITDPTTTSVDLFPSDSEDDLKLFNDDAENDTPVKKVQQKKKAKSKPMLHDVTPDSVDTGDIVQEFSASDW